MLRGNPPPPPTSLFFLFLSISFPSHFQKNLKIFGGGGLNPLNPPPLNTPLTMFLSNGERRDCRFLPNTGSGISEGNNIVNSNRKFLNHPPKKFPTPPPPGKFPPPPPENFSTPPPKISQPPPPKISQPTRKFLKPTTKISQPLPKISQPPENFSTPPENISTPIIC